MSTQLTLQNKRWLGGNIWVFMFVAEPKFSWIAGQFIRVELPHPTPDAAGTKRHFTITSAPAENIIHITTRVTSSTFKQTLAALPNGGVLHLLDPPAGDFTWPVEPHPPLIFAAQGIGVTPVISQLRQRHLTGQPLNATLVHANLTRPAPFPTELMQLSRQYPEFTYITSAQRLTPTHLAQLAPNLTGSIIYASSPHSLIGLLGPPYNLPANRLKQDQFTGYVSTDY